MRIPAVLVAIAIAGGCGGAASTPIGPAPAPAVPPPIEVPAQGTVMRVVQRTHAMIPGSRDRVDVALGDITAGRVHVVVAQPGKGAEPPLATADVAQGDAIRFTLDDHGYTLTLETMTNVLVGDDWVELRLVADEPTAGGATAATDERSRIESLIAVVAGSDIVFVRNGREHTASQAADHLRDKWSRAGDRITTVDAFIDQLGSRSSQSGEAYRVRLPDGTERDSGPWLREQLAAIEAGTGTPVGTGTPK